ncbi:MAG: radical SAM protein [Clostridia bacterium]|nr:radical SAM protein [Clostridia bacterium]
MDKCNICPRKCNIDRSSSVGFCLCNDTAIVSKTMLHKWEEPPISAQNGSGAVFFSGCTLKCVYCQNQEISRTPKGTEYTPQQLADIFLELQSCGAHNINLVTPTHFTKQIISALDIAKPKLNIPIVYNTSGYERVETLKLLKGYVDVYLPDFKYYDRTLSMKYSKAPDYFDVAINAVKEMYEQVGAYRENNDGLAEKGIIIRHLVLPGCRHDSVKILEEIKNTLPIQDIKLSLMSQFTPDFVPPEYKELSRKITSFEYNYVLNKAIDLGYDGFFQQKDSASAKYTPSFTK